jgi:hypothetical protein
MRKAGATIRLEAYRRARLEQIRHNIYTHYNVKIMLK